MSVLLLGQCANNRTFVPQVPLDLGQIYLGWLWKICIVDFHPDPLFTLLSEPQKMVLIPLIRVSQIIILKLSDQEELLFSQMLML